MIPISLDELPIAYVALASAVIALLWVAGAIRSRRRERRSLSTVVQCATCGSTFEPDAEAELPKCPCCGSPNERIPPRIF